MTNTALACSCLTSRSRRIFVCSCVDLPASGLCWLYNRWAALFPCLCDGYLFFFLKLSTAIVGFIVFAQRCNCQLWLCNMSNNIQSCAIQGVDWGLKFNLCYLASMASISGRLFGSEAQLIGCGTICISICFIHCVYYRYDRVNLASDRKIIWILSLLDSVV